MTFIKKSKNFILHYTPPNSNDNGIDGIQTINIYGNFTQNDIHILNTVLDNHLFIDPSIGALTLINN